jgi:anti-sigma factor RsiW
MACPVNNRLSAYHDGELDSASAAEVRGHVERCAECAAELAGLASMSKLFVPSARPRLSQMGLYRMHDKADTLMNASVLRTARVLRLAAAFVLAVSSVWMMRSGSAPAASEPVAAAPPWMDVAVTATAETNSLDATTPAAAYYLASVANRADDLP